MNHHFKQFMNQATRLTRSGNLVAATAAIQAALQGSPSVAAARHNESDIIEVEARVVPEFTGGSGAAAAYTEEDMSPALNRALSGDVFLAESFRNVAGQRSYKLYVPPNPGEKPLPLVVMLHGCTQDADDFAAGTAMNEAARAQGFYVLYPVQSRQTNPQMCWNWFKHNHQQQGRGEPAILAGMTRAVMERYEIDPQRVYVGGLSAGGAMAAILAGAYPDLYAAAGVHSGLAPGVASDLSSALSAMKGARVQSSAHVASGVPTIVFHGDNDATVHPDNARGVIVASVGPDVEFDTLSTPGARNKRHSTRRMYRNPAGEIIAEYWEIHGAGHAWAGGTESGSYTDGSGPDATAEMLRFFFEHTLREEH